jgi:aryl carrier-like protein
LGEIEEVLTQHEQVKEAVVTLYEADSKQTLAAYVTIEAKKLSIDLRDYLKNRLPDYMQPTSFTVLDKLPLTSIHDNFFSLGGDSILSIQIVAQARKIGLTFTPNALFEHQTIAELASIVDTETNNIKS